MLSAGFLVSLCLSIAEIQAVETKLVYPGKKWAAKRPEQVGLDATKLKELSNYTGGFGCVVRNGVMVYTWGMRAGEKTLLPRRNLFTRTFCSRP